MPTPFDIGRILQTAWMARSSYRTLGATLYETTDWDRLEHAYERRAEILRRQGHTGIQLRQVTEPLLETRSRTTRMVQIWLALPDRGRFVVTGDAVTPEVLIVSGRVWRSHSKQFGFSTNADDSSWHYPPVVDPAMFNPAPLLARSDFSILGTTEQHGRLGLRLSVRPRCTDALFREDQYVSADSWACNERDAVIDLKCGFLLEQRLVVDGMPFVSAKLDNVRLDEEFDPALFEVVDDDLR